jgi:hypothetical protein
MYQRPWTMYQRAWTMFDSHFYASSGAYTSMSLHPSLGRENKVNNFHNNRKNRTQLRLHAVSICKEGVRMQNDSERFQVQRNKCKSIRCSVMGDSHEFVQGFVGGFVGIFFGNSRC